MRNQGGQGTLLVLAAAVLWGTTGTAQALAPEGAHPISIGTLRLIVGGLALLLFARMRGVPLQPLTWPRMPLLLTGLTIATYQLCFFGATARTGVAVGTIVGIGSAPIFAGILSWLRYQQRPGWRWIAATALAICGCVLLTLPGREAHVDLVGVALAFGAGLSYALYAMGSKELLEYAPPDAVMAAVFCLGAIILAPLLLTTDLSWLSEPRGLLVILHLGLITTSLSYILFVRGLSTVPAATAVTLSLAEPLTAGILGVVVVGEELTALAMIGIGLLFGGLALLSAPVPRFVKFGLRT